jgi:1-deoxy-D-xylulose-5-phosphate reductoisomerase
VVAQLGTPDMRVPIAYGLSWPERIESGAAALDFHALAAMTFEAMDEPEHVLRFPGLRLAWETLRGAPGSCAILNAANEVAVEAFLNKRIRFDQIHDINRQTLDSLVCAPPLDLQDLLALDAKSRQTAVQNIARLQ